MSDHIIIFYPHIPLLDLYINTSITVIIHFTVGTPPMPSRPTFVEVKSTSVTIEWSQSVCDGGHSPQSFTIRYSQTNFYSYSYVNVQNPSQRRYKITGLSYSTSYQFSVRTTTVDSRFSSYSPIATINTLPQGN